MAESRRQSNINAFVSSEQTAVVAPKKRERKETEPEEERRPKETPVQEKKEKAPVEEKKSKKSDLEKLIKASAKQHGVQKCVYFESDVMEYLDKLSKDNNVNFSKLVNLIIRSAM